MTLSPDSTPAPISVPALLDALGGNAVVAKALGKGASTISEMRRSGSINVRYWPAIIGLARNKGVCGVDSDSLMRICIEQNEAAE